MSLGHISFLHRSMNYLLLYHFVVGYFSVVLNSQQGKLLEVSQQ